LGFFVLFQGLISHLGSTHDVLLFQCLTLHTHMIFYSSKVWPFISTWYYGLESKFYLSLPIWIADSWKWTQICDYNVI
jgi:peptidoglycan/LPS O-acetylase OafA/YrhL